MVGQQPPLENVTFRFDALRDPIPNVIALPNGSIYITTGMLATLENEEQLAGVMAHSFLATKDRGQAEPVYRRIIDREPSLADAHYGLGLLLEQENRKDDAAAEYRRYLDLAPPTAVERRRVERRLAMLSAPAQDQAVTLQRACVVPADVQVKRSWVEDSEALTKQTAAWKEQLGKLIGAYLTKAGVEILPFRSTTAELLEVRAAYNLLADDLENHSKDVKKGQFTIDDAVAVLPCAAAADTVVFIRGRSEAVGKTMKLGWDDAAALQVSFIDARSGSIFDQVLVYGDGTTTDTASVLGRDLERRIEKGKKQR